MATDPKVIVVGGADHDRPNIKGDRLNFILLTYLYLLNSIVGGMVVAIPNILQKNHVTYEDQAEFNFVWYPLSFKILWAPIVDSLYFKRIGRRKSWLMASQYFMGALLFYISMNIDNWLGSEDGKRAANVRALTVTFSLCNLSGSFQDIALDAWSLTIFQKKNVSYSAVCQSVGSTIGFIFISTGFIVLNSKDFCNMFRSVPQEYGFVSCANFVFFWSITLIVSTTLILLFKKELDKSNLVKVHEECKLGIRRTYMLLLKILRIPQIQMLCWFSLTRYVGNAPIASVAPLKLLDSGISQDTLALLNLLIFPLQLFSPMFLNRYVTGHRPLLIFPLFFIIRLLNGIVYAVFVYIISDWKEKTNALPTWYYWPLIFVANVENFGFFVMMMTMTSMFARISDARYGGVYMTLLNSINNIGSSWPSTMCLGLVNWMTIRSCSTDGTKERPCSTLVDGFYIEIALFTVLGLCWIYWAKKQIAKLEQTDSSAFIVKRSATIPEDFIADEKSLPLVVN